jgi:hypothetical protein
MTQEPEWSSCDVKGGDVAEIFTLNLAQNRTQGRLHWILSMMGGGGGEGFKTNGCLAFWIRIRLERNPYVDNNI